MDQQTELFEERPSLRLVTSKRTAKPSKKDQILSFWETGVRDVQELAQMAKCRPSYVSSVLQRAGHISGYFDLYTSTGHSMNVYSKFFTGRMGFKDEETARRSIRLIDRLYRQFERSGDRAGQHHALVMAMTMFNRARWTGKPAEAELFRLWLADRIGDAAPADDVRMAA
ncbi:MAG: hypothetical protein AAGI08_05370 [Bacteroidota bacterium]